MAFYANLILDIPLKTGFYYSIPESLRDLVKIGQFAKIPFRNKDKIGCIIGFSETVDFAPSKVRPIKELINPEVIVPSELLELTKWISSYYYCSWGEALFASTPASLRKRSIKFIKSVTINTAMSSSTTTPKQQEILNFLGAQTKPTPISFLVKEKGFSASSINTLQKKKFLHLDQIDENSFEYDALIKKTNSKKQKHALTEEQLKAVKTITKHFDPFQFKPFLLLGITGSGKTEVYLEVIQQAIERNKQAIMLVPEIALTPQTVAKFKDRFNRIAIMHSNLSNKQRLIEWRKIQEGQIDVVIGARSAIFAPLSNLGVIIVDEEHEASYKQDRTPRYNAKDIAVLRAQNNNAAVVLGSATPSLESYVNSTKNKSTIINLRSRIGNSRLPTFHVIDLKDEVISNKKFEIFSSYLLQELKENIKKKHQSIIFINRKGFYPHLSCKQCGETIKCTACDIGLTVYRSSNKAACNYCGYSITTPKRCPECNSEKIMFKGYGTERVEQVLGLLIPEARILRMDAKTMTSSAKHEEAYAGFKNLKYDILIGTQMIAKGLDFPKVTLVGILQIDSSLSFLDFRMAEKTYQLICQVAGRAGRSEDLGKVVIQTFNPEHYVIEHAILNNFKTFAEKELENRRKLSYPPYCRLAKVLFRSKNEKLLLQYVNQLAPGFKAITQKNKQICLGPAPAGVEKLENDYRIQFLFKCDSNRNRANLLNLISELIKPNKDVRFFIDVDPQSTL